MNKSTIEIEDAYAIPFFDKTQISIERGEGVYVYDENNTKYLDFTSGWGVTSIGHANPVITEALTRQAGKIIQNPNSGATYSPSRAKLLSTMQRILPSGLKRLFFSTSGAEANDAVIKLARKASGKMNIISTLMSFHGRTISTASATGQAQHREKFNPLMPGYIFVPFNDIKEVEKVIEDNVAAVILEPIQGEGGIRVPDDNYLVELSQLCRKHNVYLILDEVQTGFFRTGSAFYSSNFDIQIDFLTMAKGIASGFPMGAFAVTEEVSDKLNKGDHGGTYCGNPLGCAVADAVINFMLDNNIEEHVNNISDFTFKRLNSLKEKYPGIIKDVRGKGLLIAIELTDPALAGKIDKYCFDNQLLLNVKQGTVVRIFPALTITKEEIDSGLDILEQAFKNAG